MTRCCRYLLLLPLLYGCKSSEKVSTFEIKGTTLNQTAMGKSRPGAVGALVQFDDRHATVDMGQLVREVKIVAEREASARQREVAKRRAASAYRHLTPKTRLAMKQRSVRYLAVETVRDAKSQGRKTVMIWDTYASAVVGNNVYDIADNPTIGAFCRFETYTASYVGVGVDFDEPTPAPGIASGPGRR